MGEVDLADKAAGDIVTLGLPAAVGLGVHWVICAGWDLPVVGSIE